MVSLRRAKLKKKREGFPVGMVDACNSILELEAIVRVKIPPGARQGDIIQVRGSKVKIKKKKHGRK